MEDGLGSRAPLPRWRWAVQNWFQRLTRQPAALQMCFWNALKLVIRAEVSPSLPVPLHNTALFFVQDAQAHRNFLR